MNNILYIVMLWVLKKNILVFIAFLIYFDKKSMYKISMYINIYLIGLSVLMRTFIVVHLCQCIILLCVHLMWIFVFDFTVSPLAMIAFCLWMNL